MSEPSSKAPIVGREGGDSGDSPAPVARIPWFPRAPEPSGHPSIGGTLLKGAVGAIVGGLFFAAGHRTIAYVAWGVGGALTLVSIASPKIAAALNRALATVGRVAGSIVGTILLGLTFVLVLTPARLVRSLAGSDDLHLKRAEGPSFWEACDGEERKRKYAGAMFATETRKPRRGGFVTGLATLIVLLAIAEGILRTQGFGPGAVLYVSDNLAGYYPAPNQKLDRYGGRVHTNAFGMRAPDVEMNKPAGAFRILMLGDSTLWGGSYVDQDALYARLLEKKLSGAAEGRKIEVLNMGVNGWGPFHERGYIEKFGSFGADLVLVCLPHDDVDREKYGLMTLPYFHEGKAPLLALEEVLMHATWRYRRTRIVYSAEWRKAQRELGIDEYEALATLLKEGDKASAAGTKTARPNVGHAEVFLEVLPSRTAGFGGEGTDVEQDVVAKLRARMVNAGAAMHYPKGLFKDRGKPEELYHDEVHLDVKGHAIYADYLFERITEESLRYKAFLLRTTRPHGPGQKDPE